MSYFPKVGDSIQALYGEAFTRLEQKVNNQEFEIEALKFMIKNPPKFKEGDILTNGFKVKSVSILNKSVCTSFPSNRLLGYNFEYKYEYELIDTVEVKL